jgi:hypothetical protein
MAPIRGVNISSEERGNTFGDPGRPPIKVETAIDMMTPDKLYGEPINFETDVSTLTRRLKAGTF